MAINRDGLLTYDFGRPTQSYEARDAILYALGLGLGHNPLDVSELKFLDERALTVLPTFAVTLCSPGMWIRSPALGVDFTKLVHSAQWAEFPNPLPPAATVAGRAEVIALHDRGEGRGAILVLERTLSDPVTGICYSRLRQTLLLRSDGGFGGKPPPKEAIFAPDRNSDIITEYQTSSRAALIYRLSGDWNPLHLDPMFAKQAGFPRPILHGLASYGMAGVAVSNAAARCPSSIKQLSCRFSGIVLPGDKLTFHVWLTGDHGAHFYATVDERKVLDAGNIEWKDSDDA